jgi:hypothetical protein
LPKFFKRMKDGGPDSRVVGYWLFEIKSLFSIVLLNFWDGSREAYHSHAFNALSWVLKGKLHEQTLEGPVNIYKPSLRPIVTAREVFHKVTSVGSTWVLSFRGPWANTWKEFLPEQHQFITLTHGRAVVNE